MTKLLISICVALIAESAFAGEEVRIDWEAKYQAFFKEHPGVAKAVESGIISKGKVMAGIKERAAEAKEAKLKALYEKMKREDPGWARVTFEQARPRLEFMLREEEAAKGDPWEAKFQAFMRQNPALREQFIHGLKKENIIRLLKHGDAKLNESDKAAQQVRSEKALKAALKIMTDAKKLKPEQAKQLHEIVFPPVVDWDEKYEQYLKDNPAVASAVKSGNPDGTKKWSFRAEFNLFSSPAIGKDGSIYIASENGKLYAVNPKDGSKKWSFQTGHYIHGSPSIAKDGTVYIGSSDKNLYAINPKDGSEKWRFAAKDQVHAPPAIGKAGTLYVGSNDGNFYALNPDGTKKWSFRTGKRVDNCSAAIGKDGTIYFGSDDNHIYALNPDGSEKWRFRMNGVDDMDSSPAIGEDGTIYVGPMDGHLYAIHGESGGLADTAWPKFGRNLRQTGRAEAASAKALK